MHVRMSLIGAAAAVAAAVVVGVATPAAAGGAVTVTPAQGLDPAGDTVTISGSGFQGVGVYVRLCAEPIGAVGTPEGRPGASQCAAEPQHWVSPTPGGTATMGVDGSFELTLAVRSTFETTESTVDCATVECGIAVRRDHVGGASDHSHDSFTPIAFAAAGGGAPTLPPSTTTTTAPTSTTVPATTPAPAPSEGPMRTATGPTGQQLTVAPAEGLDPASARLRVAGSGFDEAVGVYVALCVDRGPGQAPSPCLGGEDRTGTSGAQVWVSSNPPPYAAGLTRPYGPGGTFDVELTVPARDGSIDCFAEGTRCVVATRADHTHADDRSADVKVPVAFVGQARPADDTGGGAAASVDRTQAAPGVTVTATGAGFLGGEQVQVWLRSDPRLVGATTAAADGAVSHTFTLPADLTAGSHAVELRGLTSGLIATSATFTVTTSSPPGGAVLARTGPWPLLPAAATALLLVALGAMAVRAGGRTR